MCTSTTGVAFSGQNERAVVLGWVFFIAVTYCSSLRFSVDQSLLLLKRDSQRSSSCRSGQRSSAPSITPSALSSAVCERSNPKCEMGLSCFTLIFLLLVLCGAGVGEGLWGTESASLPPAHSGVRAARHTGVSAKRGGRVLRRVLALPLQFVASQKVTNFKAFYRRTSRYNHQWLFLCGKSCAARGLPVPARAAAPAWTHPQAVGSPWPRCSARGVLAQCRCVPGGSGGRWCCVSGCAAAALAGLPVAPAAKELPVPLTGDYFSLSGPIPVMK